MRSHDQTSVRPQALMAVSFTTNADPSLKSKINQLHLDSYFDDKKAVVESAIVFS